MIYPIERLLEFDLNNPKSIKVNDIVDSLIVIAREPKKTELENKLNLVLKNLDEKRAKAISKKIIEYKNKEVTKEKNSLNKLENFKSRIEKVFKSEIDENKSRLLEYTETIIKENELNLGECKILFDLMSELINDVTKMFISIKETNSQKIKKEQFLKTKLELVKFLKNMGKLDEAEYILNEITYSKIYSFTSYSKEWAEKKRIELINEKEIRKNNINKILSIAIKEVKKTYKLELTTTE
jgi:hypothetical protein